jgi:hypothetical protein
LYKYSEKIDFTELAYLGPVKASKNKFWKEVFDSWNNLKELHLPRYPDPSSSPEKLNLSILYLVYHPK